MNRCKIASNYRPSHRSPPTTVVVEFPIIMFGLVCSRCSVNEKIRITTTCSGGRGIKKARWGEFFSGRELFKPAEMLEICCHEMRFENLKCVKVRLRPGFRPGLHWWSLQRSLIGSYLRGGANWFKTSPPPKMLRICCHEIRYEVCKCIKMLAP